MTFTLSLTLGWIIVILLSIFLFAAVTFFCHTQGFFDGRDTYGIGGLFMIISYLVAWGIPSLLVVIVKLLFFT